MEKGQTLSKDGGKEWHCNWTGLGLRLGEISDGALAIDCDGIFAIQRLKGIIGGDELPHTVSWSSGKPGRQQLLIHVPQEYWPIIRNQKFDCGNGEYLEFRWNGCQSVLPPSRHPETGAYTWINSPTDTPVMSAPVWLLNHFKHLAYVEDERRHAPIHNLHKSNNPRWDDIDWALSYLAALSSSRADHYDTWVRVGMALHSCSDSLLGDWEQWGQQSEKYKSGECASKWRSFKRGGVGIGTLAYMAKEDGWESPFKKEPNYSHNYQGKKEQNGGVNMKAPQTVDGSKPELLSIPGTAYGVSSILKDNLPDFEENYHLEKLFEKSILDKRSFWMLVKNVKCKTFEVEPEDIERLEKLFKWDNQKLDWLSLLPAPLANAILHDARILCVDPIALWQYIMPAAASCLGKDVKLDARSHKVPCILWACLVAESGTGKSRAAKVALSVLKDSQNREKKRHKEEMKEYKKQLEAKKKDKDNKDVEQEILEPRPLRKWIFQVTTIQALMKKLGEQAENGSIWARDEISGIFSSLNQFANNNESEAMECLLELWDGSGAIVDRVDEDDSYDVLETCLSIAGGIQPAVFRKAFKDKNDANGLQARFLYAHPRPMKQRVTDGSCILEDVLGEMYEKLEAFPKQNVALSREAFELYKYTVDQIEDKIETVNQLAYRTWLRKLSTHILRIALVLHGIECAFDPTKDTSVLTEDTFAKANTFGVYYSHAFDLIKDKISDSDEVASILMRIHDLALNNPTGVTVRECTRRIRALTNNAKAIGLEVGTYTRSLMETLVLNGKGIFTKLGQALKYKAKTNGEGGPGGEGGGGTNEPPSPTPPDTEIFDVGEQSVVGETVHDSLYVTSPTVLTSQTAALYKAAQEVQPSTEKPTFMLTPIVEEKIALSINTEEVLSDDLVPVVEEALRPPLNHVDEVKELQLNKVPLLYEVEPSPWDISDQTMEVATDTENSVLRFLKDPLEELDEHKAYVVRDLVAMFTEAVSLGEKELIESVFDDLLWNNFNHLVGRVWLNLSSWVREEVKRIAPNVYQVWAKNGTSQEEVPGENVSPQETTSGHHETTNEKQPDYQPSPNSNVVNVESTYAPIKSPKIDWVRVGEKAYKVVNNEGKTLSLRQSGFQKIVMKVKISEVSIIGFATEEALKAASKPIKDKWYQGMTIYQVICDPLKNLYQLVKTKVMKVVNDSLLLADDKLTALSEVKLHYVQI